MDRRRAARTALRYSELRLIRHPGATRSKPARRPDSPATIGSMEIMGVQIRTIVRDNVARRCDGCHEIIEGTPWRVNLLDIVAAEAPVAWTDRPRSTRARSSSIATPPACVAGWPAATSCSAVAARSARSCGRSRSRPIHRAGACATGSIATITSSSPPDGDARDRSRPRRSPVDIASAARLSSARLTNRSIPRFTQDLMPLSTCRRPGASVPPALGRSVDIPIQPEASVSVAPDPDRALVVARTGQPAGRRRSRHAPALGRRRPHRGLSDAGRPSTLRTPHDRRAHPDPASRQPSAGEHGREPGATGTRLPAKLHDRRRQPAVGRRRR